MDGAQQKRFDGVASRRSAIFWHAFNFAQQGAQHRAAKVLKGFGSAGVLEVIENSIGGTYRAVYTIRYSEVVIVLHCFQKKSKFGIATPKADMEMIKTRLKAAEELVAELRK